MKLAASRTQDLADVSRMLGLADEIMEYIRSARLLGSDETSARVEGVNHREWVFQNEQVCLHVIRPSRGQKVIEEVMAGHSPEIWVSDLYSSQKANPAQDWQVCLAHQLRDCQYAMDAGDDLFAPRMKRLFLNVIALHRRRVEIHWETTREHIIFPLNPDKLWQNLETISISGMTFPNICPENLLPILCVNYAKDHWPNLKMICDIAHFIETYKDLDWNEVLAYADSIQPIQQ